MNKTVHITRYEEFPAIPLLLDQVLLLSNQALADVIAMTGESEDSSSLKLTASMVNNYVKRKLVPPPAKKRYTREQLCRLTWICMLKQVMGLDATDLFFREVTRRSSLQDAYDGFCSNVEALLGASASPAAPLDELVLAAAQAVASQVRVLQLVNALRPAAPIQSEPDKKQGRRK